MNYAEIKKLDVANGPGVRVTLFVSGCTHNCSGCFNKAQQDFTYGKKWTKNIEDEFIEYCNNSNVIGVSILGGEPMQQVMDNSLLNLLIRIHKEVDKPVWLWTGYMYEELLNMDAQRQMLQYVDVLIDGKFDIKKKDSKLLYRGSYNQRVIDVQYSLFWGKTLFKNI